MPVIISGERRTFSGLCEPEMALTLPQGLLLRDRERHIGDIIVGIAIDNSVRRISLIATGVALIVTGIHLVDPVEDVVVEFVITQADEVAVKYSHE